MCWRDRSYGSERFSTSLNTWATSCSYYTGTKETKSNTMMREGFRDEGFASIILTPRSPTGSATLFSQLLTFFNIHALKAVRCSSRQCFRASTVLLITIRDRGKAMSNYLWTSFVANTDILVCSTADGTNWSNAAAIQQSSKFAPSLAVFNDRLYVAFVANNPGNGVLVCSTADGTSWTDNTNIQQASKFAPSLAVFNNRLYVAFIANNSGNAVLVCSTPDGTNWTDNTNIQQTSQFAPSLGVFNNRLYVAFIANNPGNGVLVCSTANGTNWTDNTAIQESSQFGPSLAVAPFGTLTPHLDVIDSNGFIIEPSLNSGGYPFTVRGEGFPDGVVTITIIPMGAGGGTATASSGTFVVSFTSPENEYAYGPATVTATSGAVSASLSVYFIGAPK
jgi:hypothetical protein